MANTFYVMLCYVTYVIMSQWIQCLNRMKTINPTSNSDIVVSRYAECE